MKISFSVQTNSKKFVINLLYVLQLSEEYFLLFNNLLDVFMEVWFIQFKYKTMFPWYKSLDTIVNNVDERLDAINLWLNCDVHYDYNCIIPLFKTKFFKW